MSSSARSWAERLQADVDLIEGLITLGVSTNKVVAVVDEEASVTAVRERLLRRGVPEVMLEVAMVTEYLFPYPNDDERLMEWIKRSRRS